MRMVLSYWEMAASMVTSGVLNEDLFLEPMQPRDPRYHGVTGLAIVDAILGGERDPAKLAKLRDRRTQASEETIRKSLEGNWGQEHLFTLRQSRDSSGITRSRS